MTGNAATAGHGAELRLHFTARRVYLVLGSPGRRRAVRILLDGRPAGRVTVTGQRLYRLVDLPRAGTHQLRLRPAPA